MSKPVATHYEQELQEQRKAWLSKPSLQWIYQRWFHEIVQCLQDGSESKEATLQPVVEIGSGCGAFHEYYPNAIATDVIRGGPWIQELVDARALPWEEASVGNIVMIDCLHHLQRPIRFLQAAQKVLKKNGRLVLWEPAATPWACWFWKQFHHEPVDLDYDFAQAETECVENNTGEPDNPGFMYANMGTSHRLFHSYWKATAPFIPKLSLQRVQWSDLLAYPLTGGFGYRSYAPSSCIKLVHSLEHRLLIQPIARLMGLRMLVVLQKNAS
jgi:SAM-dependent methyltransferase